MRKFEHKQYEDDGNRLTIYGPEGEQAAAIIKEEECTIRVLINYNIADISPWWPCWKSLDDQTKIKKSSGSLSFKVRCSNALDQSRCFTLLDDCLSDLSIPGDIGIGQLVGIDIYEIICFVNDGAVGQFFYTDINPWEIEIGLKSISDALQKMGQNDTNNIWICEGNIYMKYIEAANDMLSNIGANNDYLISAMPLHYEDDMIYMGIIVFPKELE